MRGPAANLTQVAYPRTGKGPVSQLWDAAGPAAADAGLSPTGSSGSHGADLRLDSVRFATTIASSFRLAVVTRSMGSFGGAAISDTRLRWAGTRLLLAPECRRGCHEVREA